MLSILLCLVASAAMAHIMDSLKIQVVLKKNGDARVTEYRYATMDNDGTEGFITFNNMGDIEVRDLKVTDEKGAKYAVEQEWDVDRSRAEKKNRCGYNKTSEGVEVCWGICDSGERTYIISYTLTNLVKGYNDYDGFNHSFYEAANTPAMKARVEIRHEGDSLSRQYAAVWTFGYEGNKGFKDGICYAETERLMSNQESIIVLLQFKKGHFRPSVVKDESFTESVKRKAFEGSSYNLEDAGLGKTASRFASDSYSGRFEPEGESFWNIFDTETWLIIIGMIVIGPFVWRSVKKDEKKKAQQLQLRKEHLLQLFGGPVKDIPYYRDLPIGGNMILSGEILEALTTMAVRCDGESVRIRFRLQQLYDAFVLRMMYKKNVKLVYDKDKAGNPRKLFRIEKPVKPAPGEDLLPYLNDDSMRGAEMGRNSAADHKTDLAKAAESMYAGYINDAGIEYYLQKLLYEAAGEDHLLQPNELKQYIDDQALQWREFAAVLNLLTRKGVGEDKLTKDDVCQTVGFLRYLRDFSLVAERNIEETGLWKEYLVYASLYGIADQVRKDMKQVAPDVASLDEFVLPDEMTEDIKPLRDALAENLLTAFTYATAAERIDYKEYLDSLDDGDSGGSGGSSYGGGGGHSGGGGSGFR